MQPWLDFVRITVLLTFTHHLTFYIVDGIQQLRVRQLFNKPMIDCLNRERKALNSRVFCNGHRSLKVEISDTVASERVAYIVWEPADVWQVCARWMCICWRSLQFAWHRTSLYTYTIHMSVRAGAELHPTTPQFSLITSSTSVVTECSRMKQIAYCKSSVHDYYRFIEFFSLLSSPFIHSFIHSVFLLLVADLWHFSSTRSRPPISIFCCSIYFHIFCWGCKVTQHM